MSQTDQRVIHVVATSHGTDNEHGQQLIHELRAQLEELSKDQIAASLIWHEAYVDVQQPSLDDVVASLPKQEPAVVLPLLVSDGVHTTSDIARAVASKANTVAAGPLGPTPQLAQVLADRAQEYLEGDPVLALAGAGTRLEIGQQQIQDLAAQISRILDREVTVGYCAGANPRISEVVQNASKRPVVVLSSLLADGYFQNKLISTGAEVVTKPLLPDVTIAQCFLVRLKETLKTAGFMSPDDEVLSL
ncbi:CbiX/SirB N-terminal domain-containing protein [Glutamicibacter ectropisis]|uniref:CbiX/SirB N-terminal domain-containing protein n=1 Tax=Glutamicibacter ectropisis TaxID=3046593 RepID=A0AAU6WBM0_9MICC